MIDNRKFKLFTKKTDIDNFRILIGAGYNCTDQCRFTIHTLSNSGSFSSSKYDVETYINNVLTGLKLMSDNIDLVARKKVIS